MICFAQSAFGLIVMQHFWCFKSPPVIQLVSTCVSLPVIADMALTISPPSLESSTVLVIVTVCSWPAKNSSDSTSQPTKLSIRLWFRLNPTMRSLPLLCLPGTVSTLIALFSDPRIRVFLLPSLFTFRSNENLKLKPSVANEMAPSGRGFFMKGKPPPRSFGISRRSSSSSSSSGMKSTSALASSSMTLSRRCIESDSNLGLFMTVSLRLKWLHQRNWPLDSLTVMTSPSTFSDMLV
mmetsp:Transcript_2597/g.6680  ORF Transcript_2597/g.6680 Transcript_2597/m.6680 type:complete len:237 (-) Transcript_2597:1762-2472(-)